MNTYSAAGNNKDLSDEGGVTDKHGDNAVDDIAFLTRSSHRVAALGAVSESPHSRNELIDATGVSSSTIRRTLRDFEDRSWVDRNGRRYEATRLGEFVASAVDGLVERMETERKLRDVWYWLPDEVAEFTTETWSEMSVTVAEPDYPYRPVRRFESLLQKTDGFRFIGPEVALMEPCMDTLEGLVKEGAEVTLVDRQSCHTYFISTYPDWCSEIIEHEGFTVLEHDELPAYGVGILGDLVVISCYEQDSGAVRSIIEADTEEAREWAESIYDTYHSEARPLELERAVK